MQRVLLSLASMVLISVSFVEGTKNLEKLKINNLEKLRLFKLKMVRENPALQELRKKDLQAPIVKEKKVTFKGIPFTMKYVPFGESLTISPKEVSQNTLFVIEKLKDQSSAISMYIKKEDKYYIHLAHGKLGNCSNHCILLKSTNDFIQKYLEKR